MRGRIFDPYRRRRVAAALATAAIVALFLYWRGQTPAPVATVWTGWPSQRLPTTTDPRRRASWGALRQQGARSTLRENLRTDKKYLVSFPANGWSNQVFDIFNLIWVGLNSNRIPVLHPFWPHFIHYNDVGSDIAVSDIFDLQSLRAALDDMPMVDLFELKATKGIEPRWRRILYDGENRQMRADGTEYIKGDWIEPFVGQDEELSCWSFWQNLGAETEYSADRFNATLQLTPLPPRVFHNGRSSYHCNIVQTSDFLRQSHQTIPIESLESLELFRLPAPKNKPDEHLACLDTAYWLIEQPARFDLHEEWRRGLGVWSAVGRFARWRPEIEAFAMSIGKRMLGVKEADPMPPYIAIHIRRGDFASEWTSVTQRQYAHLAQVVMKTIYHDLGIQIKHVLVTTDEEDPAWLAPLREYGFIIADHQNQGLYDSSDIWLPIVIDSVLLGNGKGFVGSRSSTMSILGYLRCKDWSGGVSRFMNIAKQYPVPEDWEWSWDISA